MAYLFVPQEVRPAALAVHQLLARILEIPEEVTEPSVAVAKLAWWRGQMAGKLSDAVHPDVQKVLQHCDIDELPLEALDRLLDAMEQIIGKSVFQSVDEMWSVCIAVGEGAFALEYELLQAPGNRQLRTVKLEKNALNVLASIYGLHFFLRLLHHFNDSDKLLPWPFPMQLQARHQMNQTRFHSRGSSESEKLALRAQRAALCRDLLHEIQQRFPSSDAYRQLSLSTAALPGLLMHHLEQRLVQRYVRNPTALFALQSIRWSPLDVVSLWWSSQRWSRRLAAQR